MRSIKTFSLRLLWIGVVVWTSCQPPSGNKGNDAGQTDSVALSRQKIEIFLTDYEKYVRDYTDAIQRLSADSANKKLIVDCGEYSLKVRDWANRWQPLAAMAEQHPELMKKFQELTHGLMEEVNRKPVEVLVDKQLWIGRNLNVEQFRNGDPVVYARTNEEWSKAGKYKQPAYCYYDNNPVYGILYGKLYNWYAVDDARGLAPKGWHIPSDEEWTALTNYLGGEEVAGNKIKSKLGWSESGNGTNSSELSLLPGGFDYYMGNFKYAGLYGSAWSSTPLDSLYAWGRIVYYFSDYISRNNFNKGYGFSVRCIKD